MKQTKKEMESLAYQKIKANDKLLKTLSELENVIDKLNDLKYYGNCQADILIYKTNAGGDWEDFYDDLFNFINTNETMLKYSSAGEYETIKKGRK